MSGECGVDGVDGLDAVVAAGDQVGADAAVAGEGSRGMPVARDCLMAFRPFDVRWPFFSFRFNGAFIQEIYLWK